MAGEIARAAVEAGTTAVMDLSLSGGGFCCPRSRLIIPGAFYLACKGPAEDAIRRALQRKVFGVVDPEVTNITDGSILVELHCRTETSLLLFLEDFETKTTKFRLEEEFKKIGFKDDLDVTIRNAEKVNEKARQIRETSTAQREGNQKETWKEKYEELAKMTNKIYEMQAAKQTIPRTEEPISQLQQLERIFSELAPRDGRGNVSSEGGESAVLESKDLRKS
ncbi:hypothetical protein OS493_026282 [Desmophyllum pertusum]|uniref:Uncharacterized protein n=1 Tax=Desmophyllum pertusum TaxID=174260 RepID=A0A9W9ZLJ8_9CNID|nr:hypothetical protein OS493_026282 [Desmophyllum pertusum]